jgi:light-regulated signal transduction histidine kinase (bacteriophytochrome)
LRQKWFGSVTGRTFTREQVVTYVAAALALGCAAALWSMWRQRTLRHRIAQLNAGLESRIAERTAELAARVGEVERLNAAQATLVRDLQASQRAADRAAASLEEANARLLGANQELEAFSYSASHDLRAPLRNVTGFLELLRQRIKDNLDDESARFFTVMTSETRRMGALIDDLLAFSRVSRAEMKVVPVNLDTLVAEVRQELQPDAAGREIEWRIGALPPIEGDLVLVRQVLSNLLGNALKFTRQRTPAIIEVGARPASGGDRTATIFVRDNGAGYDPKYAEKLFGVFQRLHSQRDFEGTGIGLANVKRIIVRHGGRVWAEGAINAGATFYFTLPVSGRK